MRALAIGLSFGVALAAQEGSRQVSTFSTNVNGSVIPGSSSSEAWTQDSYGKTTTARGINGRIVPSESIEERVVYRDAIQTVRERLTQHYDYDGKPAGQEKERIQESSNPDGSQTVVKASYQQDLNGRFQLAEQVASQIVKSGANRSESAIVQRPGLNGSMETVARVNTVMTVGAGREQERVATYRKDVNGRFYEASRTLRDRVQAQPGLVSETTVAYEADASGKLEPTTRTLSQIRKLPDGSEVRESTIYSGWAAGRTGSAGGLPLLEQWLVERRPGAGNTVQETTSVRKPGLDFPPTMGNYQTVSQSVCTGKCQSGGD